MRAYFVSNSEKYFSSDIFGQILAFVQKNPRRCKMKDSGGKAMLIIESIASVDSAIDLLNQMAGPTVRSSSEIFSR
jgi:transcription-repair coupling factor (superfamily II helicase)